jgi:hypothetical protein
MAPHAVNVRLQRSARDGASKIQFQTLIRDGLCGELRQILLAARAAAY